MSAQSSASRIAVPSKPGTPGDWLTPSEREEVTDKSLGRGLSIVGIHFALYFATIWGAVAPLPVVVNILFGIANGALIGLLFLIGHDGGHNAFVPGRGWNKWITRAVFVPCLHSYSQWDVVHHKFHHANTNLKGHDHVWPPMSKQEFDEASRPRQWLERFYRGPLGPVLYYWTEFWAPKLVIPVAKEMRIDWRRHVGSSLFVIAVGGGMIVFIGWLGSTLAPARPLWQTMLVGWVLPFAVWNYLMAMSIYLQHNHPGVAWFDRRDEWSFYRGGIRGSVDVELPFRFLPLFSWVMLHPSHHALPSVPIYRLPEADEKLIAAYGDDIVRYRLSFAKYREIYRACKLFDYRAKQWTDFNGVPTAEPVKGLEGAPLADQENHNQRKRPKYVQAGNPRNVPGREAPVDQPAEPRRRHAGGQDHQRDDKRSNSA